MISTIISYEHTRKALPRQMGMCNSDAYLKAE